MQLICDVLVHDSKSSACLNEEQRSVLTSFSHKGASVPQHRGKRYLSALYIAVFAGVPSFPMLFSILCLYTRLSVIDESSFLSHSDISYDRTDDDLVEYHFYSCCRNIVRPECIRITERIKTIVSENDFAGMISRTWTTPLLSLSSQELVRGE